MAEILDQISDIQLISIKGGSRVNVIPRDVKVKFRAKETVAERLKEQIKK